MDSINPTIKNNVEPFPPKTDSSPPANDSITPFVPAESLALRRMRHSLCSNGGSTFSLPQPLPLNIETSVVNEEHGGESNTLQKGKIDSLLKQRHNSSTELNGQYAGRGSGEGILIRRKFDSAGTLLHSSGHTLTPPPYRSMSQSAFHYPSSALAMRKEVLRKRLGMEVVNANGEINYSNSVVGLSSRSRRNSVSSMLSSSRILPSAASARELRSKASELIIRVPARQFRRMAQTRSISSLQAEIQHFVGVSTVNGLLRIYRSKGLNRCFWTLSVGFCFLFLIWQIVQVTQLYLSRPTVSHVSFLLPESGLAFPAITICSYNPIRREHIETLNQTGRLSHRLLDYFALYLVEPQFIMSERTDAAELEATDAAWKRAFAADTDYFSVAGFFKNASLTCSQVLKICSFGGREFDCCAYAKEVMTDLGKCFQINLAESDHPWLRRRVHGGVLNGLQIVADFLAERQIHGHESAIDIDGSGPPYVYSFENGFRFYIHHRGNTPFMQNEGNSVSPGMKIYSAINPTRYILLPEDAWGNCTDRWPPEFAKLFLLQSGDTQEPRTPDDEFQQPSVEEKVLAEEEKNDEAELIPIYTSMRCKTLCRAHWFYENCGCAPFTTNVEGLFRVCTPFELYKCLNGTVTNGISGGDMRLHSVEDFFNLLPSCTMCKMECNRHVYHAYNTYAHGFSRTSLEWFQRRNAEWTPAYVLENFVTINVFYRDMSFTEYRQVQSISITATLSDIGGNMGLFLGMSLISLVEAVTFLAKISWLFISKKRRDHMLAKKRREEEREHRLQATLDAIINQQRGTANKKTSCVIDANGDINLLKSEESLTTRLRRRLASVGSRKEEDGDSAIDLEAASAAVGGGEEDAKKKLSANSLTKKLSLVPGMKKLSTVGNNKKVVIFDTENFSKKQGRDHQKQHQKHPTGLNYVDAIMEDRLHGDGHRAGRRPESVSSLSVVSDDEASNDDGDEALELKIDLEALGKGDRENALTVGRAPPRRCHSTAIPPPTFLIGKRDGRRTASGGAADEENKEFNPLNNMMSAVTAPWMQRTAQRSSSLLSAKSGEGSDKRQKKKGTAEPPKKLVVPSLLMRTLKPQIDAQTRFATRSDVFWEREEQSGPPSPGSGSSSSGSNRRPSIVARMGSLLAVKGRRLSSTIASLTSTSTSVAQNNQNQNQRRRPSIAAVRQSFFGGGLESGNSSNESIIGRAVPFAAENCEEPPIEMNELRRNDGEPTEHELNPIFSREDSNGRSRTS